jgi:hypothetical protein
MVSGSPIATAHVPFFVTHSGRGLFTFADRTRAFSALSALPARAGTRAEAAVAWTWTFYGDVSLDRRTIKANAGEPHCAAAFSRLKITIGFLVLKCTQCGLGKSYKTNRQPFEVVHYLGCGLGCQPPPTRDHLKSLPPPTRDRSAASRGTT